MALWSGVLPWDRGAQLKPLEFLSLRFIFNGLMFKMGQEGWIWGNLSDQAMTETLEQFLKGGSVNRVTGIVEKHVREDLNIFVLFEF